TSLPVWSVAPRTSSIVIGRDPTRSAGDGRARVAGADLVDEAGQLVRDGGVPALEDVLRVPLARAREVEAPDEGRVVGDDDLRVHEVVDGGRRPGGRDLAAEGRSFEDALEERDLPRAHAVRLPLVKHLVDLGVVQ